MTNILVYSDTATRLERIAEKHDMTIAEVIDIILPDDDTEIDEIIEA